MRKVKKEMRRKKGMEEEGRKGGGCVCGRNGSKCEAKKSSNQYFYMYLPTSHLPV